MRGTWKQNKRRLAPQPQVKQNCAFNRHLKRTQSSSKHNDAGSMFRLRKQATSFTYDYEIKISYLVEVAWWHNGAASDLYLHWREFGSQPEHCCNLGQVFRMSPSRWKEYKHTTWYTGPVSVVLQLQLVYGSGTKDCRTSVPTDGLVFFLPPPEDFSVLSVLAYSAH